MEHCYTNNEAFFTEACISDITNLESVITELNK